MSETPYLRTPGKPVTRRLRRLAARLPSGVELYHVGAGGRLVVADRDGVRELRPERDLLRFIDAGQFAHYLVGDAGTSPERPSSATVKLGLVAPRSAFTPHAHGGEHFVLSAGHAACGLYDAAREEVTELPLVPGVMIRIPEMMPHSFANRGNTPLTILAANTGYGIDHEDYAITADEAERRAAPTHDDTTSPGTRLDTTPDTHVDPAARTDYRALAAMLRAIEDAHRLRGTGTTTILERLAARLRTAASTLDGAR